MKAREVKCEHRNKCKIHQWSLPENLSRTTRPSDQMDGYCSNLNLSRGVLVEIVYPDNYRRLCALTCLPVIVYFFYVLVEGLVQIRWSAVEQRNKLNEKYFMCHYVTHRNVGLLRGKR